MCRHYRNFRLLTVPTSRKTRSRIFQSAFELRLECMDGDRRNFNSAVCKLPSPVRQTLYSDPGNILLAENLKKNVKYFAKMLSCKIGYNHQTNRNVSRTPSASSTLRKSAVPGIRIKRNSHTSAETLLSDLMDSPALSGGSPASLESSSFHLRSSMFSARQSSELSPRCGQTRAASSRYSHNSSPTGRDTKKLRPQTAYCDRDNEPSLGSKKTRAKSASATVSRPKIKSCSFSDFGRPLPISYNKFLVETVTTVKSQSKSIRFR